MKTRLLHLLKVLFFLGLVTSVLARPTPVRASTYTVNSTDDSLHGSYEAMHCSVAYCTLRGAIAEANSHDGPDVIEFNIPGTSPHTIRLEGVIWLEDDSTTIAGDTQPGYSRDLTYPSGLRSRGRPAIIIDGTLSDSGHGLSVASDQNVIRALSWINFTGDYTSRAVGITGDNNRFEANFLGLSPDGAIHHNDKGLNLEGEENYVLDNVISGNDSGIYIWHGRHEIQGNLIGTDPTGTRAAGENSGVGISMDVLAHDVLIGGEAEGDRNIISGFSPYGYGIFTGGMDGTRIINNFIGTNAAGDAEIRNWAGISLAGGRCTSEPYGECTSIIPSLVQGNLISGNVTGILANADRTIIRGNKIGTNAAGTAALGSQSVGIDGDSGRHLLIGGYGRNEGNLVSGNNLGILLEGEAGNAEIFGNKIGTNLAGSAAIPNGIGVMLRSGANYLGNTPAASGNLISGNGVGVWIDGESNTVRNNRIGTNDPGSAGVPNHTGINVVGDIATLAIDYGNLIAFNSSHGIVLEDAVNVFIYRNIIHSNGGDGIYLRRIEDPGPLRNRFRENSIYNNGGLGIRFDSPDLNDGVEAPVLTRVAPDLVEGTACPGCVVEIFESDRDPSGFGEGKEFLTAVEAGPDGRFHADLVMEVFDSCDSITATALDTWSSSVFSSDVPIGPCATPSPFTVWIIIILTAAGVGALLAVVSILRRWRGPFGRSPILPGLLGGVLGAGIAVGLLSLPVVHIQWPVPEQPPACGQFIDDKLLLPENGRVFEPGTDVLFELSPQPDPPGMRTRWFLEVTGSDQTTVRKELVSNSISLSELGFDPKRTGIYLWTLTGERSQTGSNTWTPLCTDGVQRMFRIAAPLPARTTASPTVTPSATNTPTATPTATETQSAPTATLLQNANCRRGPGTDYDIVTNLPQGVNVPILGRNPNSSWWQVQVPGTQTLCWVFGENVETSGDTGGVPIVEPPPLGCWVWTGNKNVCTVPCPEGAQPGGVCTP